jgi:ribosome assembly protein RRB1
MALSKRKRGNGIQDELLQDEGFKYTPAEPLPDGMQFEDDSDREEEMYEEKIVDGDEDAQMNEDDDDDEEGKVTKQVWHPKFGRGAEEQLDYDPRAYKVFYKMKVEWPSLSFDVIKDNLGDYRGNKYPLTATIVAGSQASDPLQNRISVYKISKIRKTKYDQRDEFDDEDEGEESEEEEEEDDDDDQNADPVVEERYVKHDCAFNRVRSAPQAPHIVAGWNENAKVNIWDLKPLLEQVKYNEKNPTGVEGAIPVQMKPLFTFKGHSTEGFAMDWSNVTSGRLITGDCNRHIYLWEPHNNGSWSVDKSSAFQGHTDSVEDLQWSPTQSEIFASCSSDRSIRIWDCRSRKTSMLSVNEAHSGDVNVISWNRSVTAAHLLVSGSDDGTFKVWDLRMFSSKKGAPQPSGNFKWHTSPITSVQWHPTQESVIAVASEDDSINIWDLGLEADHEAIVEGAQLGEVEIPPQLSFIHRGMNQVKELHFHSQIPSLLVCTTEDGFDIFKPDNL